MKKRIAAVLIAALLLLCSCRENGANLRNTGENFENDRQLSVDFIDVGQGDSILICSGGQSMLVDAGTNESGKTVLNFLSDKGIKKLDYAVGTHPHADHIGGLDDVIRGIDTDSLLMPNAVTDTKTFNDVLDAAESKGLSITVPEENEEFSVGQSKVTVLSKNGEQSDNLNNSSLVLKVTYGKFSLLLTGDAEKEVEMQLLSDKKDVSADVLKVGHHGSETSTSGDFLKAVSPKCAVISCGKNNDYGHPHEKTLKKLEKQGTEVYRTDISGTISLFADSDGRFSMSVKGKTERTFNGSDGAAPDRSDAISSAEQSEFSRTAGNTDGGEEYILNIGTKKFHKKDCKNAQSIIGKNKKEYVGSRQQLINDGYAPCGACKP